MVVLAFDQSYTNIGYSVYEEPDIKECGSIKLDLFQGKPIKRSYIKCLAKALQFKWKPDIIVVEQIRLFNRGFVKLAPIVALAEASSSIVDGVYPDITFSVDSRSWKSKVIGNASATKECAVRFVKEKFGIKVDHDTADAICMSMYPLCKKAILNVVE